MCHCLEQAVPNPGTHCFCEAVAQALIPRITQAYLAGIDASTEILRVPGNDRLARSFLPRPMPDALPHTARL